MTPALTLHDHPLASYCWKVLIALALCDEEVDDGGSGCAVVEELT